MLEAIALRVHQLTATLGLLAAGQEPPLSHALHLVEESLGEVETRLTSLSVSAASGRPTAENAGVSVRRR